MNFSRDGYFAQLQRWLAMEGEAERQRMADRRLLQRSGDAERTGETIVNLQLSDHRTGLAGRLLLDLVKANSDRLPRIRICESRRPRRRSERRWGTGSDQSSHLEYDSDRHGSLARVRAISARPVSRREHASSAIVRHGCGATTNRCARPPARLPAG